MLRVAACARAPWLLRRVTSSSSGSSRRLRAYAQLPQTRGFAVHASIASQMDLLASRYDDLSAELSQCVLLLSVDAGV